MNKRSMFAIIVIIILIGSAIGYVLFSPRATQVDTTGNATSATDLPARSTSEGTTESASVAGVYTDYDAETFSKYSNSTRLLFFHASWCPQCRELDASIRATDIPDGVVIFKVDYDTHQDLRQRYSVTIQTTVVLVDNLGNKKSAYVAYDEPTFTSVKGALLD